MWAKRAIPASDLGGAADADAIIEACGGHFVGLVHDGRDRCHGVVDNRHGQGIALDRIDRQADAERRHHPRRIAAERADIGVGGERAVRGDNAGDSVALGPDALDLGAELERHSGRGRKPGHRLGEEPAVAGIVVGQAKRADERHRGGCQSRFGGDAAFGVEHLVGHAVLLEDLDVAVDMVELLLLAEELQRPLLPAFIGNAGRGAQLDHLVARIFGDAHHARLVEGVSALGAIGEQLQAPQPHPRIEHRPDDQRAVDHQQPFDGLDRNARAGPGRGVAVTQLAGIAEAGLEPGARLALDDGDLMSGLGQVICRGGPDDAGAQDEDFHAGDSAAF